MNRKEEILSSDVSGQLIEGGVLVAGCGCLWDDPAIEEIYAGLGPVAVASGGAEALERLENGTWRTLLLGADLPDLDSSEVAQIARRRHPHLEVRILHEFPRGDGDEYEGPSFRTAARTGVVSEAEPQMRDDRFDRSYQSAPEPLPGMVGNSELMQRAYELVRRVAKRATTVLITGATGTGKEVVARAIHQLSSRAARPFVVVNCAAIPETLLESELFGFVRGAFTGAVQSQAGRISAAHGGTLFLDEVGELPLSMQAKLLRFIELKEVQRLGSVDVLRVDARVVAASNNDLAAKVREKHFREDLFYRLAAFSVALPTLQDRSEDILPLARHFLAAIARSFAIAPPLLSQAAIRKLECHSWPGNVRELQLVIERACILAEGEGQILPEHIRFAAPEMDSKQPLEMRGIAV